MYSYSTFSYGFLLQVNSLLFWNSNFLSVSPGYLILLQFVRFHSLEINELGYIAALLLALELHYNQQDISGTPLQAPYE